MARILVAEDREDTAELLRKFLTMRGHTVEVVGDGAAAVERSGGRDLYILDAAMPKVDGFGAAKRIRADDRRTPILMITAHGDAITAAHARRSGIDHVIHKPFDLADVIEAVGYLLRHGRQEAE